MDTEMLRPEIADLMPNGKLHDRRYSAKSSQHTSRLLRFYRSSGLISKDSTSDELKSCEKVDGHRCEPSSPARLQENAAMHKIAPNKVQTTT